MYTRDRCTLFFVCALWLLPGPATSLLAKSAACGFLDTLGEWSRFELSITALLCLPHYLTLARELIRLLVVVLSQLLHTVHEELHCSL